MSAADSTRLIISAADVSACFAQLGKAPPGLALFAALPAAPAEPSAFLTRSDGSLLPLPQAIFDTLSDARISIALQNLERGSAIAAQSMFLTSHPDGPFVMVSHRVEEGIWDLALVGKRDALLVSLELMLRVYLQSPQHDPFTLDLDIPALACAAALADVVQYEQARAAQLDQPFNASLLAKPLALHRLRAWLEQQQAAPDMRSIVSQLRLQGSGALLTSDPRETVRQGLVSLREMALVDEDDVPTRELLSLIAILQHCQITTGFTRFAAHGDGVLADAMVLLQAANQSFLGLWQLNEQAQPQSLRIIGSDGQHLLSAIDAFVAGSQPEAAEPEAEEQAPEPVVAPSPNRFCAECGTPHEPGQKFCKACGAKLN